MEDRSTGGLISVLDSPDRLAELLLTRFCFGLLQTLATRPFSKGNEGAFFGARRSLDASVEQLRRLERGLISEQVFGVVDLLTRQLDYAQTRLLARSLHVGFRELLQEVKGRDHGYPRAYDARPAAGNAIDCLVIEVGPTIGIGDELLAARAIAERVAACNHLDLVVSTARRDLWRCLSVPAWFLARPPLAACEHLAGLSRDERWRCGYLFLDYQISDPVRDVFVGPSGTRLGARWFMGAAMLEFADFATQFRHSLLYPRSLPQHRLLESRWLAHQLLEGASLRPAGQGTGLWRPRRGRPPRDRIVIQALTSKNRLLLPPKIYAAVFSELRQALGRDYRADFIPAPTESGRQIVHEAAQEARKVLGSDAVHEYEPQTLDQVAHLIQGGTVLFGPDTFSSHLAALAAVPQVTVRMPEHYSWVSLGAPCFGVAIGGSLVGDIVRGLKVFLARNHGEHPDLQEAAHSCRHHLARLDQWVDAFLAHQLPPLEQIADDIVSLQALFQEWTPRLNELYAGIVDDAPAILACNAARYLDRREAGAAVVRWYSRFGTSRFVSILSGIPPATPPIQSPLVSEPRGMKDRDPSLEGILQAAADLRECLEPARREFLERTGDRRNALRRAMSVALDDAFEDSVRVHLRRQTPHPVREVVDELRSYAARCGWILDDVANAAAELDADPAAVAERVGPHLRIYHAFRMVDDVLDGHVDYKGTFPTAYGNLLQDSQLSKGAAHANILFALMLVCRAVGELNAGDRARVDHVLWGTLTESVGPVESWSVQRYRQMVEGKMVSYGMLLYGPLLDYLPSASRDAARRFLERTFYLGQLCNDLLDRQADRERCQPNLWNLELAPGEAEAELQGTLDKVAELAAALPSSWGGYATVRHADLLHYLTEVAQESLS